MRLYVETTSGSNFSIEIRPLATVLDLKKKIEKSQGFTVSSQELYFKGTPLVNDMMHLIVCHIVNNSRLLLVLPDGRNIKDSLIKNQGWPGMVTYGQMLRQAMPSLVPSNATEGFVNQRWPAIARRNDDQMLQKTVKSPVPQAFFNHGSPEMAKSNNDQMLLQQTEQSPVLPQAFFNQGSSAMARSNGDQELHQTVESLSSSCSIDELLQLVPDMPVTAEDISKLQSWIAEGNVNIQESSGRNENNQDLLQSESSHPSNTFGDFSFGDDRFLSAEHVTNSQSNLPASTTEDIFINKDQVFQTEQSTVPSNTFGDFSFGVGRPFSTEHLTNIQSYYPAKLRVMVLPYPRENKSASMYPVNVNASEKVRELRKELEKIQQRSPLDLPQEGYVFLHKLRMLDDDQSFRWNGVAHGDTIGIYPDLLPIKELLPIKDCRAERLERTFGI